MRIINGEACYTSSELQDIYDRSIFWTWQHLHPYREYAVKARIFIEKSKRYYVQTYYPEHIVIKAFGNIPEKTQPKGGIVNKREKKAGNNEENWITISEALKLFDPSMERHTLYNRISRAKLKYSHLDGIRQGRIYRVNDILNVIPLKYKRAENPKINYSQPYLLERPPKTREVFGSNNLVSLRQISKQYGIMNKYSVSRLLYRYYCGKKKECKGAHEYLYNAEDVVKFCHERHITPISYQNRQQNKQITSESQNDGNSKMSKGSVSFIVGDKKIELFNISDAQEYLELNEKEMQEAIKSGNIVKNSLAGVICFEESGLDVYKNTSDYRDRRNRTIAEENRRKRLLREKEEEQKRIERKKAEKEAKESVQNIVPQAQAQTQPKWITELKTSLVVMNSKLNNLQQKIDKIYDIIKGLS